MKKLFLYLFLLATYLLQAQVTVLDVVTPAGNFQSTNTSYVKGSLKNVVHHDDLFTIPVDRLELGMLATVADSSYSVFQLTAITPIMTWEKLTVSAEAIESDPIIYGVYQMSSIDSIATQIQVPFDNSTLVTESGIKYYVDSLFADLEFIQLPSPIPITTISLNNPGVQSAIIGIRDDGLLLTGRDGIQIFDHLWFNPTSTTPVPEPGKLYVNSSNQLVYYNGTAWIDISALNGLPGNPILSDVTTTDTTNWGKTPNGLEKITEGSNTGWRLIGVNPANYGNIGPNAVDLSTSSASSSTMGATGNYSYAEGYTTTASGNLSHAEGSYTTASGYSSHAEGYTTIASGEYSHAEGILTTASGRYSHAEGYTTIASGNSSHAEGNNTTASGTSTHSGGAGISSYKVIASGKASFNHSEVTASKLGAAADNSGILGGKNNEIPASKTGAIILGGNSLTATKPWTAYVQNLQIASGDTLWFGDGTYQATAAVGGGSGGNPILANVTVEDTTRWGEISTGTGNPILVDVTTADTTRWAIDTDTQLTDGQISTMGYIKSYTETDPILAQYLYVSPGIDSSLYLSSTRPPTTIQKDGTTLIGNRSGLFSTDLRWSTGIGYHALKSSDAYCITAVGASAGRNIATGSNYVVAIGTYAGDNHSGGGTSVFIGDGAGKNSVGLSQTFVGSSAGENVNRNYINGIGAGAFKNATFQANSEGVAYGNLSGYGATNLKDVVFIGNNSGHTSTGTNLTYLGISAGYKSSSNFTTAIGTSAFYKGTGDKSTYLGAGAGQLTKGGNNIGIGALTLSHSGTHYNNIIIGNQTDTLTQYRTNYDSLIIIGNYIIPTADRQAIFGGSYTKDVILKGTGIPKFNSDTLATLAQIRNTISGGIVTETDPIFTAWDKDYTDLINQPTIADWEAPGTGTIDKTNIDLDYTDLDRLLEGSHGIEIKNNAQVQLADSLFEEVSIDLNGNYFILKDGTNTSFGPDIFTINFEETIISNEFIALNANYLGISSNNEVAISSTDLTWQNYNGNITANDNIVTKGYTDATYVEDDVDYGYLENASRQMRSISSATPTINFNDIDDVWNYTVNTDIAFQPTTNSSSSRSKIFTIRMTSDGSAHNLTFPSTWKWISGKPTQILANTQAILTVQNFGSGDSNIVASYVILSNGE